MQTLLHPRIIASVWLVGLPLIAPIQATPSLCATPQEGGRIKTSSQRWGFYIEILSREISHKHKRGVPYEARIVFDNKWGSFCCSWGFFRRISIIESSHFFEIVVSGITRSSFCTSYSISWTSTKPESSNGIVTHNTSQNIELIIRCCRSVVAWWSCTTKYWSISNKWRNNIFYTWINPDITTCTIRFFQCNQYFWFLWSGRPNISIDIYISFDDINLVWYIR